jgi:hypothetical protein
MKKLFSNAKGLTVFDTKETVIELNGVKIEAFPSYHLDSIRGLPNVSFILLDEADFFPGLTELLIKKQLHTNIQRHI